MYELASVRFSLNEHVCVMLYHMIRVLHNGVSFANKRRQLVVAGAELFAAVHK